MIRKVTFVMAVVQCVTARLPTWTATNSSSLVYCLFLILIMSVKNETSLKLVDHQVG
jgi:hypothetical protein